MNNKTVPLPDSIDGVSGEQKIADMWSEHFKRLLNSVREQRERTEVERQIYLCEYSPEFKIEMGDIRIGLDELKCGNACGYASLLAEHMKYAYRSLTSFLAMCFSSMLVHGLVCFAGRPMATLPAKQTLLIFLIFFMILFF